MDREELLKEIKAYQAKFKEWDINFFQHEREKMNILNPYFGYKPVSPYEYNNGQGVRSLWMAGDSNRMVVEARPRGYSGDEIRFETDKMTERQLDGIRVLLKTLCEERRKDIERTQANPILEEMLPEIGDWARRCIRIAGKDFSVALAKGRRQSDGPQSYQALVVFEKGHQIASIPLRQDEYGKLTCKVNHPLYGSSDDVDEFTLDNWKDKIREALEGAVELRINMDREDSPVRNPEVNVNYYGQYTITCEIDGQKQLRKPLADRDLGDYIRCRDVQRGFYLQERRYELAEKYYKKEIDLAMDNSQYRGVGR